MRMRTAASVTVATLSLVALSLTLGVAGAEPTSPDQAQIETLQKQADSLSQELAKVKSGADLQTQQKAMQSHWTMMQDHMRSWRQMPGMDPGGCTDWMMMDPSMMRGDMMGPGMKGADMMGSGAAGGGCWGHSMGMMDPGMSGWTLPNETPAEYEKRMQTLQQDMRKQMAAIAAETDPAKRDALMRQHYETMYRNMQTMRGMGWMWNRGAASALPDASSRGATLEAKYCSQCHAAPSPGLHTVKEWVDVTGRMQEHIGAQAQSTGNVLVPSTSDFSAIVEYLDKHAKPGA